MNSDTSFTAWYQSLGIRIPRELGFGYPSPQGGMVWSIGLWEPMDIKFGLRPWKCKNITTRCGLMLNLGMGLPRKNHGTKLGHYVHVYVFCVIM